MVSGFGKFCVKEKREKRGRNQETDTVGYLARRLSRSLGEEIPMNLV
jgi:nucleoid DNA-binding protein